MMRISAVCLSLFIVLVAVAPEAAVAKIACPRALASPTRAWIDSTGQMQVSTPTLVDNEVVYPDAKQFEVRGVAYAPAPIGARHDEKPYGDWYTQEYKFLWSIDIPRMAEIGINLVRVYDWKLFDAANHLLFLDTLYENKMYALIPFQMLVPDGMGGLTFKEIDQDSTRKDAVKQFIAFAKPLISHPAVLGFMIGNELDTADRYGSKMQLFFSVVNDMVAALHDLDTALTDLDGCREKNCKHFVTAPFTANNFDTLYANYFWSNIDFWSLQSYDSPAGLQASIVAYSRYAASAVGISAKVLKPMILTERGTGSVRATGTGVNFNVTTDEAWQAQYMTDSYTVVANFSKLAKRDNTKTNWAPCLGMVIMEWNDEWWKGTINSLPLDGCPEDDANVQSNCGTLAVQKQNYIIAEEKLGLCAQVEHTPSTLNSIFIGLVPHSLQCKKALTSVCTMWKGKNCNQLTLDRPDSRTSNNSLLILNGAPFLCLIVTLIWGAILLCLKKKHEEEDEIPEGSGSMESLSGSVVVDTVKSAQRFNAMLPDEVDVGSTDPRLDWICEDLLRRGEIRHTHDAERFRLLWACVCATVAPSRQGKWSSAGSKVAPKKFSDADVGLSGFCDAIDMLHKETMAYIGMRNWRDRFSKIPRPASSDEPDVQLQEIILYYSARLEHHAMGHSVEFVTENYLTMREALIFAPQPVPDADRDAAWTALAARVHEGYNVMFNGQLHEPVRLENNALTVQTETNDGPVSKGTTAIDGTTHMALKFAAEEQRRFRIVAGALDRVHGDDHVRFLRPVAVDEAQRVIAFVAEPETRLGEDLEKVANKFGPTELVLHVCYSLEMLHSVKLTHGSLDCAHMGKFELRDKRDAWVLLPSTTLDSMTLDRLNDDLVALGKFLQAVAEVTKDELKKKQLDDIGQACQQSPPLSLEQCIDLLQENRPHLLETPEKPPSYEDLNQTALDQRDKHGGKSVTATLVEFRRSFQEVGGLTAAICNYSFFIRFMLWQWVWAYTSQPVLFNRPMCAARTTELLAVADGILSFFTYACEWRLLSGSTHTAKKVGAIVHMLVYLGAGGGLYMVGAVVEMVMLLGPVTLVITPHSLYIIAVIIIFIVKDVARFCATSGRGELGFCVRKAEPLGMCASLLRGFLYTMNWILIIGPVLYFSDFGERLKVPTIDTFDFFLPSFAACGAVLAYNVFLVLFARVCGCCQGGTVYKLVFQEQLGAPTIFWMFNYVVFNVIMCYLIVPGVAFVDLGLCSGKPMEAMLGCNVAWVFNWAAFIVVSFALFGILYVAWTLLASLMVAFARSIGELHNMADVLNNLKARRARSRMVRTLMRNVRGEADQKLAGAVVLFEAVLQSLVDDFKMSADEKEKLMNWFVYADMKKKNDKKDKKKKNKNEAPPTDENGNPIEDPEDDDGDILDRDRNLRKRTADRDFRLENEEAEMVVVMFLASLENMPVQKGFDVVSMPSFTAIVPYFNEIVYHDFQSMRAQPSEAGSGVPSDLRMAAAQWPDEWRRLLEDFQRKDLVPKNTNAEELLETYHRYCYLKNPTDKAAQLVAAIEQWATYRNQTLARIVRGLGQLRKGLMQVAKLELAASEPFSSDEDLVVRAEQLVTQKCQIIIGAQIMSKIACKEDGSKMTTRLSHCQLTNLIELQAANPFTEFVFEVELENGETPVEKFEQMLEHVRSETDAIHSNVVYDRVTSLCGTQQHFCGTRYYSCHVTLVSQSSKMRKYELNSVERPGPLLLGPKYAQMGPRGLNTQGKAENQFHAAQFARGANFFTLDMNQDMNISEGFKLPTMLHHFLGGNKRHRYGIVGFTERCYTRSTSLAGELSGASEFAFVTIVQRVLRSALRIRLHYGHPDLMSGLLARTIGFNKASHGVNVNEDIFAGFECIARGVPIGFCEWIWFWKGRDTSLRLVAIFNNKLAEGAAQQVRSRDMHFLNANLNWLARSSLLLGTVGFYWMSVLLHASIRLYIWALILFEVSGVTNFDLGIVDGIISVAWAFQLGYVMALPGLIENTVQYGLLSGVMRFCRTIVPSVFFHAFMLQVTSEGFLNGLFTNSASYAGTGRGYDLAPVDVARNFMVWGHSHYWKGVELLALLVWYMFITSENSLSYFIRTVTVWILIASLFGAPLFFQCPPSAHDLSRAGSRLWTWALRKHEAFGSYKNLLLPEKIEDTERRSYRTWFTRRFASPVLMGAQRGSPFLNFMELMLIHVYRELPVLALMLCYFEMQMVPLMLTALFIAVQTLVLRRMFSGKYQRHFSRIMMITSIIVIVCLAFFYFAASVLLFAPVVTLLLVAYLVRFVAVLYFTLGTARRSTQSYIDAGMKLAWLDYPAVIIASSITYLLAWVASKGLRTAIIGWNYSARFAQECRRADDKRLASGLQMSDNEDEDSDEADTFSPKGPKSSRPSKQTVRREQDAVEARRKHQDAEMRRSIADDTALRFRTSMEAEQEDGPFCEVGGTNDTGSPLNMTNNDPFEDSTQRVINRAPRVRSSKTKKPEA